MDNLTADFWDKYFKTYDVLNEVAPYKDLLNKVVQITDVNKGELILDAGSGTGNLALPLEAKGAKVVGLDISPHGVSLHKKKIPGAEAIVGNIAEKLPFDDSHFDKTCSVNVLFDVPRVKRLDALKELHRVLKTGGKIILVNISEGYKPMKIYLSHIKNNYREKGVFFAAWNIVRLLIPTIKMFFYSRLLRKNEKENANFFRAGEQEELLKKANFSNISKTERVFAGQAVMNIGYKL